MPHYLDNIWGDQATVRGFGDALNQNFAALVEAKARQQQSEQAAALNAAYYALERQRLAMQGPGMRANAALSQAEADKTNQGISLAAAQDARLQQYQDAAAREYRAAHPVMIQNPAMQGMPPQGPLPMTPTANQFEATIPMPPQQVPSNMPTAPTMMLGRQMDQALLQSLAAREAVSTPATAQRMLDPVTLRPGDVPINPLTGERGQQVPYTLNPYQQFTEALRLQQQQDLQDYRDRSLGLRQEQIEKPKKLSPLEQAIEDARKKREGSGGGTVPAQQVTPPQVGEVRRGYRFKGGDPAQQFNWEAVR